MPERGDRELFIVEEEQFTTFEEVTAAFAMTRFGTLSAETPSLGINEHTTYDDLMTMLPVLRPKLEEKQAEYGESLLHLAKDVAPKLFQVLRRRLTLWQETTKT